MMRSSQRADQPAPQPRPSRLTLGLLGGPVIDEELAPGADCVARAHDANLIVFAGGMLESRSEVDTQRAVVAELVGRENVDGLYINTDFLGHEVGAEGIQAFCARFQPLPMVQCEVAGTSAPTVVTDFYQGMVALVTHLIRDHGARRIAFIQGPEQSVTGADRYRAYRDTLHQHGLAFDPLLVAPGSFFAPSGREAVALFFERRRLRAGVDVEAIVCVNDYTAIDALPALRERGIRVPEDVALVGFDDLEGTSAVDPPLTTVYLPAYEAGLRGMEVLLGMLEGQAVSEVVRLAAPLVIRQSCGCANQVIHDSVVGAVQAPGAAAHAGSVTTPEALAARRPAILEAMTQAARAPMVPNFDHDAARLLDAVLERLFRNGGDGPVDPLPVTLVAFAEHTRGDVNRYAEAWQGAFSGLRRALYPYLDDERLRVRLEDLCHQGRALVGQVAQQTQVRRKTLIARVDDRMQQLNHEMATTLEVGEVVEVLARALPELGVPSCYLSAYEDPGAPGAWARMILAYDQRGRVELPPEGLRFPSRQLIPERLRDTARRHTYVVEPLGFRQEQFGFVVLEMGLTHRAVYEDLREQISSTVKRVQLHQEAVEARRAAEEANRLKSRFLSVVSHELRTPLNMIVGLSDLLLREDAPESPTPYRHEIEVIRATGQHLNRLVRDVLDLGRSQMGQLALTRELLNLADLVADVVPLGEQLARDKGLGWQVRLVDPLPYVWGDRARLRQVALNLLSNAAKFTNQGEIIFAVDSDGETVTLSVEDTGLGVPLDEQDAIFSEFRQTQRTTMRGYGGMGLGLAISRRLVEMHGGEIGLHSSGQEGSGATFHFTLPVVATRLSAREHDPVDWREAALIVSQGGADSSALRDYLEERGFKAIQISVGGSDQWLAQVRLSKPGAIVLDCRESVTWCVRLMQVLQQDADTRDIPVLLYRAASADASMVLDVSCLSKPLDEGALLQFLDQRGITPDAVAETGPTLLVVDDEPDFLWLHVRQLQALLPRAQILTAQTGHEALQAVERTPPDLILLDLMMPELDGFAVLEALRSHEPTRAIPVIVLTACTLTEDVMARLSQGVTAVLSKGVYTEAETLQRVEEILARTRRLGSEAQRIARQAVVYIHAHYAEPVTRDDLARHVNVSARYLTRCFREEMGITPVDYLNRYRVERARQLLLQSGDTVTEIALAVGFSSSSYFSRVFRQETGVSPTEYRERPAG